MKKAAAAAKGSAAVLALAAPLVAYWEGMVPWTYADPVGIPTICYGHTGPGVNLGVATMEQCRELLEGDLAEAWRAVQECIPVPMEPHQAAALVSFTYNVGRKNLCRSTLAAKARAGDWAGACAEMSRWVYARGVRLRGLERRRAAERAMCEGRQVARG